MIVPEKNWESDPFLMNPCERSTFGCNKATNFYYKVSPPSPKSSPHILSNNYGQLWNASRMIHTLPWPFLTVIAPDITEKIPFLDTGWEFIIKKKITGLVAQRRLPPRPPVGHRRRLPYPVLPILKPITKFNLIAIFTCFLCLFNKFLNFISTPQKSCEINWG